MDGKELLQLAFYAHINKLVKELNNTFSKSDLINAINHSSTLIIDELKQELFTETIEIENKQEVKK